MYGKEKSIWRKTIISIKEIFLDFYPLAFGAIIVWSRFVQCTTLFFDILVDHKRHFSDNPPDWETIFLWLSIGFWTWLHRNTEKKKEQENGNKLQAMLADLPHFRIYEKTRKYLDNTSQKLYSLRNLETAFEIGNYENIAEVAAVFSAINLLTKRITSDFFNIEEEIIGVNYMIFIKKDDSTRMAIANLLNGNVQYIRSEKESDLIGLLYLAPELNDPVNPARKLSRLSLPIYPKSSKIYNAPHCNYFDDITLPGAPSAFLNGNSFIENTKNKNNYVNFNEQTQQEIINYFGKKATETKSLISFRIPKEQGGEYDMGVLNIETSRSSAFPPNENYFNHFYTILYPTLKQTARHLGQYKKYLIDTLQKS